MKMVGIRDKRYPFDPDLSDSGGQNTREGKSYFVPAQTFGSGGAWGTRTGLPRTPGKTEQNQVKV